MTDTLSVIKSMETLRDLLRRPAAFALLANKPTEQHIKCETFLEKIPRDRIPTVQSMENIKR